MEIKRILETTIKKHLVSGKVNVLYGARRVGKTFLIKKIEKELGLKTLWINGEDIYYQKELEVRSVINYKRLFSNIDLLIIDEAQVIPNVGKILKLIVDEMPELKIIASGSSAFDLSNKLGEPLVGRAYWHELFPFAQTELKNHENLVEIRSKMEERIIYGSYPDVYNLENVDDKAVYLKNLVTTYLLKDIINYEGIRNSSKIYDLLKLIAYQIGKEVSLQELSNQLEISKITVEKYLDLLEKVYVLKKIRGFSKNLRKEVTKSSSWYFWDTGVRNAVLNDFRTISFRNDFGDLWENYLFIERLKKNEYERKFTETYFWRTYDQQEIDCIEVRNQEIEAFEFKWGNKKAKIPIAFANAYPEAKFSVITKENYLDFIE
ncbi:MAG: ATP-binding protein [Emticicia sp.]